MTDDTRDQDAIIEDDDDRRRAVLLAQFSERPIEEVLGLVGGSCAGGYQSGDNQWILAFTFHCWKLPPGPMKTGQLVVEWTLSREEFQAMLHRIDEYTVYRIRARVVEGSSMGDHRAQLVEFLGTDPSDPELNQAAVDLQIPVVVRDRQFGELTLDRSINWYAAETNWNGAAVELHLLADQSGEIAGALTVARSLWKDSKRLTGLILDRATQELLPVKNENWLDEDEGEAELTARQLRSRMTLESITVNPNGSFEFRFDDGDLFLGHWIMVRGTLSEGPTDAEIAG